MRKTAVVALHLSLALCACARGRPAQAPSEEEASDPVHGRTGRRAAEKGAAGRGAVEPKGEGKGRRLSLHEAERYFLELVNRDRSKHGLGSVEWDEQAARAGRVHAQDMARHGYTAHWGTDGSVPEQRYTDAGGTSYVQENAACLGDGGARSLDEHPTVWSDQVEEVEAAFMNERPPNDGHRKNILTPWHNRFGAGIAKPAGTPVICVAEEFTDVYGKYAPLPATVHVGATVEVAGEVLPPARFGGVGLARIPLPAPRTPEDLNQTHTYRIPQPYVSYFPKGFVTPVPVDVQGNRFAIRVPLSEQAQSGLYEISVWAHLPGTPDLVMVSLRSVAVR